MRETPRPTAGPGAPSRLYWRRRSASPCSPANSAIIESLLFGQQAFAWGAALLLLGIAAWRRERPLAAALLVGLGQATHAAIVLPIGALLVAACLPFVPDRRALLRWYALSVL